MMTIANRLRGSYGWFASVFGLSITVLLYLLTGNLLASCLIGVGYWFGEMICGWGNHIGVLCVHRWKKFKWFPEDGEAVGVRWLTSMLTHPRLYGVHFKNAKNGLYNTYARAVNFEIRGYSLAKVLHKAVEVKPISTFEIDNALTYARVFLVIRGLYWWLLPMLGVSLLVSTEVAFVSWLVLSFGWVVCAEIGYLFSTKFQFHLGSLSYEGGSELQEGAYGVLQDLVLLGIILSYWMGV